MALQPRPKVTREGTSHELSDALESLRRGTLQQFESEWVLLGAGEAVSRRHGLGEEVPAVVSVDIDDVGDGRNAIRAVTSTAQSIADVTVESDVEKVTITNDTQKRQYFRIRAR